jgi:hexosaminidase
MPWPANVTVQPGAIVIDNSFTVAVGGVGAKDERVRFATGRIAERLARQTGIPIRSHFVPLTQSPTLTVIVESRDHKAPQRLGDNERYSLVASNAQIRISADAPLGALRGIETFLQLVRQNTTPGMGAPALPGFSVPAVSIHDEPRFPWRGLSLDVSRHFIPLDVVKRTIDGLSAMKMNVFHWHLSDDQGFRIESKHYPRLQRYGSDGLFYTQAEVREVLAYARDRGVRVVPEFDIPGHATSWLVGYPSLGTGTGPYHIATGHGILTNLMDPTKESTYRFLNGFIGEMARLFPDEYFHIGGDEVTPTEWNTNPRIQRFMRTHHLADAHALQAYFNKRLLKIVTGHGKHMEGWDEILHPDLPKSIVIQSWRGQDSLAKAASEGYRGLLSAGYYLDLMQSAAQHYAVDPLKTPPNSKRRTVSGPVVRIEDLTPEQKKLILGGEAAMWVELATPENLDSRLWPRTAAIAERLWSPESVTDVSSMYRRLYVTNHWLEWLGLTQRPALEEMRQRLAGTFPAKPLDDFSSVMEPVKGYSRHAERYQTSTPLNRLVDATAPESNSAREFRDAVDKYLQAPHTTAAANALEKQLGQWLDVVEAVRPSLQQNSLLLEDNALADSLATLCHAGQEAISYLVGGRTAPTDWKQQRSAAVVEAAKPKADLLVQIAPGIQKLVDAVRTGQH